MAPTIPASRAQKPSLHIVRPQLHQFVRRRQNWAAKNPGVVLVFCIVFIVFLGLVSLYLYRKIMKKRAENRTLAAEK